MGARPNYDYEGFASPISAVTQEWIPVKRKHEFFIIKLGRRKKSESCLKKAAWRVACVTRLSGARLTIARQACKFASPVVWAAV
jgi:hypothetical protein